MKYYGLKLKSTREILGVIYITDGGDEFTSMGTEFKLTVDSYLKNVWLTEDKKIAEKASGTDSNWYSAGYETPRNPYTGDCEVFEIEI
jgi:hypothetical protein